MGLPAYKLWNQYITEKHLSNLFRSQIRKKDYVGMDWITVEHFSQNSDELIKLIVRKANSGEYKFTSYRELLISKGAKKAPRCISIPTIRDRILLLAMNEIITKVYGKNAVSPMPQVVVSEIQNAISSKQYDSFIKLDISSFYSSIDHEILLREVAKTIRKKELRSLISGAITTPTIPPNSLKKTNKNNKGLPEGLSISNSLANVFMIKIDEEFSQGQKDCMYWRYVDDILILTTHKELETIKSILERKIEEKNFVLKQIKHILGKSRMALNIWGIISQIILFLLSKIKLSH